VVNTWVGVFFINIRLIAVGKMKEGFYREGSDFYKKKISPYARLEIIEVPEAPPGLQGSPGEKKALDFEEKMLLRNLREDAYLIILDAGGEKFNSPAFASHLERLQLEAKTKVDIIIGGPVGLSPELKKRPGLCLSLSEFIFPHRLARLIILEQLYRSFKIIRGEPYHR
jgi:23S rRNA (pseudouridine1915-N3)-methyltransferase